MGQQHALARLRETEPEESGEGAGINVQSMRPGDLGRIGNNTDGGRPVWPCNCAGLYLKDVGSGALGRTFLKPHVEFTFPRKIPQKEGTLEGDLCLVPGSSLGVSSFLLPSLSTHSNKWLWGHLEAQVTTEPVRTSSQLPWGSVL